MQLQDVEAKAQIRQIFARGRVAVAESASGSTIQVGIDEAQRRVNVSLQVGPDAPDLRFSIREDSATLVSVLIECAAQYLAVVPKGTADA